MTNPPPASRPLSIKIISIIYLVMPIAYFLSVLLHLFPTFPSPRVTVFGFLSLSGASALCAGILQALVYLYLSVGLWGLQNNIRRLAIGYECYHLLNAWMGAGLAFVIPSLRDAFTQSLEQKGITNPSSTEVVLDSLLALVVVSIFSGTILWFLFKRKSAFVKPTTPTQAST